MYRSENALHVAGPRLLVHFHDIVETARKHNAANDIGGFLMFDRARFHQILEGREDRIDILFARIKNDRRHTNIECLAREPAATRYFDGWSMGSFIYGRERHPVIIRHGLPPHGPIDYEPFLKFTLDFIASAGR